MDTEKLKNLFSRCGNGHVFDFWDDLGEPERGALVSQLEKIDFGDLDLLRSKLAAKDSETAGENEAGMRPAPVVALEGASLENAVARGERELRAGRVAALVVAGGQGSRLGFDGPKGCYPVGPVSRAPLFFFHARKILALKKRFGASVPFYVMTSETNDAATRAFFRENHFFGLDENDVFFFVQGMWPALSPDGKIILDRKDHVFFGPDGHGGTLAALKRSGALADMQARGIESVFYFQVDNPMVEIADPAFIGAHVAANSDFSVKVCAKRDPQEGLGVVVERGGKTQVVEYTELTDEEKCARAPDGELLYKYGSVAIHVFSVPFLAREAEAGLPLHIAHKKVPFVDKAGNTVKPAAPNAYKFEKFIFDALRDARNPICIAFDRECEFSPVKNAEGADSPATCAADLSRKWARWLAAAGCGIETDAQGYPLRRVEIDPAFAADAATLKAALAAPGAPRIPAEGDILLSL